MLHIVAYLLVTAIVTLLNRGAHSLCNFARIHNHQSILVAGCTTGNLCNSAHISEHTLHIGIDNCNERHLRKVKTLTQQVYTDKYIE